jgi:hypothetical protein
MIKPQPFIRKLSRSLNLACLFSTAFVWTATVARQPNILVILADDLG